MRYSTSQINLKFDRVSMTLRRGGAVMIRDGKGQAALIRAAEFSDIAPERLENIATGSETLCLTKRHMTSFGLKIPGKVSCFTVPADTFDDGQITALILGDGTLLPTNANILAEERTAYLIWLVGC